MAEFKIKLDDVEKSAAGQWGYILAKLAPDLGDALEAPKKHHACPVHGGKDGFRLFNDYEQKGGGICNTCGPKGGGISLIMWVNGWNFKETLEAVAGVMGLTEETELQPQKHEMRSQKPIRQKRKRYGRDCEQCGGSAYQCLRRMLNHFVFTCCVGDWSTGTCPNQSAFIHRCHIITMKEKRLAISLLWCVLYSIRPASRSHCIEHI